MAKNLQRRKKEARRRGWIMARYLFMPFAALIVTVSLFIPCLRYTTPDSGTQGLISVAELTRNSWDQVRNYLFGTAEQTASNVSFSWAVLFVVVLFVLLYLLGLLAIGFFTVGTFRYFRDPKDVGRGRILFLTLFPNRVTVCLSWLLLVPLTAFPRLIILFYKRYYYYSVLLNVRFLEPLAVVLILLLVGVGLTIGFASLERAAGIDPHKRRARPAEADAEEVLPIVERTLNKNKENEEEDAYAEMNRRAREEQAERIRQLLRKNEDEE